METQQVIVRPDAGGNEKPKFDIDRGRDGALIIPFVH